jgi:hypothetical protein
MERHQVVIELKDVTRCIKTDTRELFCADGTVGGRNDTVQSVRYPFLIRNLLYPISFRTVRT